MSENQTTLIDECSIYEWIDYWQQGNTQCRVDVFKMNEHTRLELEFAAKAISHMLATLRDIADIDPTNRSNDAAVYDAVRMAKNAIAEYAIGVESKTVTQAYSSPEVEKPLMPPWVKQ